jgi:tryptophan 2,3-dioxygenase
VPEERLFIVIHQLFELVFKQMTFDIAVVARTLEALESCGGDTFRQRVAEPLPGPGGPSRSGGPP